MTAIDATPFRIHVPDAVLTDLKARLALTRWPDAPEGGAWRYGTSLAYMKNMITTVIHPVCNRLCCIVSE